MFGAPRSGGGEGRGEESASVVWGGGEGEGVVGEEYLGSGEL